MEDGKISPVRIRISNFQSIEQLDLEVRGFTCVTGPTNIGKSAIIRAISSAMLNESVVGMVRKGAAFATVDVRADGWGFTWEKGERGVNRYTIGGKILDKVGQSQIEDVAKMGFFPVKVGSRKLNPWCASQFLPIFLLDESGPAVTDFISEVSNLQVMQDASVLAARGRKRALDEAKQKAEEAARFREREARVRELDGLEEVEAELEQQAASIEQYEGRLAKAEQLNDSIEARQRAISQLEPASSVKVPTANAGAQVDRLKEASFWNGKLISSAHRILAIQGGSKPLTVEVPVPPAEDVNRLTAAGRFAHLPELQELVQRLESASKAKVPDVESLRDDMNAITAAKSFDRRLSAKAEAIQKLAAGAKVKGCEDGEDLRKDLDGLKLLMRAAGTKSAASLMETDLAKMEEELVRLTDEIRAIPSCPTCGKVGQAPAHAHAR